MSKTLNEMLNPKQIDFMLYDDKRINLLTGSVRSGKTYVSLLKWAIFVGSMPENSEFLMTGKTITALKRNCLGLLQDLVGDNFKYSLSQKTGTLFGRRIWLEGANDDRAESKIRGMTLAGAYVDELTQIPEDFYRMLLSRLSIKGAKLYATTNPDTPTHWVKLDIIDNEEIDKKIWHFNFDDNEILKKENQEYFDNLKKEYQSMGEVYYQRFILGLWCVANGAIYKNFANNSELFIREKPVIIENGEERQINFMILSIGIDYGASEGATKFTLNGITSLFKEVWTLDEEKFGGRDGLYSPEEFYKKFEEFYNRSVEQYGKVTHLFCDWGALGQVLTYGLNRYLQQHNIPIHAQDCIKGEINDRIYLDNYLFAQHRHFILSRCKYLIEAYKTAIWSDSKPDTRLDDGTVDIDSLDSHEYSINPFFDKLMMKIR